MGDNSNETAHRFQAQPVNPKTEAAREFAVDYFCHFFCSQKFESISNIIFIYVLLPKELSILVRGNESP